MNEAVQTAELFRRTINRLERLYEQGTAEFKVTMGELAVLSFLDANEPVLASEICRGLALDKSNAYRILLELKGRRLIGDAVTMEPGRAGRHPGHYYLLPAGLAALHHAGTALAMAEAQLLSPLRKCQRDAFRANLALMAGSLS